MKRCMHMMERILRWAALLLLGFSLLFSLYSLADMHGIYARMHKSAVRAENHIETGGSETEDAEGRSEDEQGIRLIVTGTGIDYPLMQGDDNLEYLNKDPSGAFSPAGSIFLDSRCHDDFTDDYSIIYGHHMDGRSMFGALDAYYDETYFHAHQEGMIVINGKEQPFHIFAIAVEDASDDFFYTPGMVLKDDLIERIQKDAFVKDETVPSGKRIIAMSTCRSYGNGRERTMVFAWLE